MLLIAPTAWQITGNNTSRPHTARGPDEAHHH
ncbi:hypothetical protein AERO8C_50207 [Aeromonas veronii]|uniref:Uncharacterized protein n=1 Tax=Aeromonas veronii TaxID=654 RepID=A0A653L8R6_AERVE|nr:hypothetical protein AERO8C_50207 [Aeromonas veronii]